MKKWFSDIFSGTFQNILATIVIAISVPIIGVIYAFSKSNPQTALLIVVILLVTINAISSLFLLRQQRIMEKSIQGLNNFKCGFPVLDEENLNHDNDENSIQFSDVFDITDKHFDEESRPQKLVIQFTNRGHTLIQITRVKYSENKLPVSALLPSYRKEDRFHYLIPFKSNHSQVVSGENFLIEIGLGEIWKSKNFNRMAGNWGYLQIEAIFDGKNVQLFTSI